MADEGSLRPVKSYEIASYATYFDRLSRHLEKDAASVKKSVELLGQLQTLENVHQFSNIGQNAKQWRESLLSNYNLESGFGLMTTMLKDDDHENLKTTVQTLRTRFSDRLKSNVVSITPETNLSIKNLRQGPTSYLNITQTEGYEDEIGDLRESTVGILVGTYTSSEFMSLRAVEGILRKWHAEYVDDDAVNGRWATALEDIAHSNDGKGPKELRLLDYLRERRNEVAHPDRNSTLRDAENTFKQSVDIVETLIVELEGE